MNATALTFACLVTLSVEARVDSLSSDLWVERQHAENCLAEWYPLSGSSVAAARKSSCAECRVRAQRVLMTVTTRLDPAQRLLSDLLRSSRYTNWPWIDSLPEGYPDRSKIISNYLARARGEGFLGVAPSWPEYRCATAFFCMDLLKAGSTESEVGLLLRRMVNGDRRQWERSNQCWEWAGLGDDPLP